MRTAVGLQRFFQDKSDYNRACIRKISGRFDVLYKFVQKQSLHFDN